MGDSSLVDDVIFSTLQSFINISSVRFPITDSKFPRFLVHWNIWYLSSNVKVQVIFVGVIWIFQFWIKIIWKFFCYVNNM